MTRKFYMPEETFEAWTQGLRSGEYKQGFGWLEYEHDDGTLHYCCLGVLQMVVSGEVEKGEENCRFALPTTEWCGRFQIDFGQSHSCTFVSPCIGDNNLTTLNDEQKLSFPEIADFLEKHYGGEKK